MKRPFAAACTLCAALAASIVARAAGAQPGGAPTLADLRGRLDEARARGASIDTTDDALRVLIDAAPGDREAPTWMLDRAEIALQRADRGGAASSVMFGLPARAQAGSVSLHAAAAADLCAQARSAIDAAVALLEDRLLAPGSDAEQARAVAAQVEPHLARLIDLEQATRLPQIEFAATALRTLSEPAGEPRERALREMAERALGAANGRQSAAWGASPRVTLLAVALLLRSDDAVAIEAASRLLDRSPPARGAEPSGANDRPLAPADALRLCMAMILCGREADAARIPCPGRDEDWLVDLLLAEAHARALVRNSRRPGSGTIDGAARAAGALLSVATRHDGGAEALDTAAGPSAMRQLIYEKIAMIVPPGSAWAAIDPETALARAWSLRSAGDSPVAPPEQAASAECLALLEAVAARNDAHHAVRAQARWLLAAEHARIGGPDGPAVLDALAQLVIDLPRTRLARAAAERIIREHAPDLGGPTAVFESHGHAAAVTSALRLLAADEPPDDATLARLAVALAGHAEVSADAWAEAVNACDRIATAGVREQIARLLTSRIEPMLRATQTAPQRVDALGAAAAWLERRGEAWRSLELRLQRLELIIETGANSETRAELDALEGSAIDRAGTVERARLRAARGIALRRAGDDAAAMAEFRAVASEFERDARSTGDRAAAREAFWRAWAEMLEIAARAGDAPERAEQARRQRQRLELLDPALGGEPWAGRIRAATGGGSK